MAVETANLVHETATTTGTGNFTLANVNGKQSFNDAFGTGGTDKFYYFISHNTAAEWEVGTGHLSASSTLVRDTVLKSSNSDAAVNFSSGDKDVTSAVPALKMGGLVNIQTFTSSGTYTRSDGVGNALVYTTGAGGGGGGGSSGGDATGAGGGGAGGTAIEFIADVGTSITVTIGAGGSGGAVNSAGSSGGNTTFGALSTGTGGGGGAASDGDGGTGSGATGGDLNITGGDGASGGEPRSGNGGEGGNGGASYWGGGGRGGDVTGAGHDAGATGDAYGSGGGASNGQNGGGSDGADGVVIVFEYS